MERVFVVDDDENMCSAVARALRSAGYEVKHGTNSGALYSAAVEWEPNLIVLDVRLGREDGRDVARNFRALYHTPILILTGQISIDDRISGLDSGADDYLCKPFDNGELVARVKALIRRHAIASKGSARQEELPIRLDRSKRIVILRGGERETLTELQANIMAVLLERANHVVTREDLYSLIFRRPWVPSDRSLDVHMSTLRKLLLKGSQQGVEIQSIRNVGYRLQFNADATDSMDCSGASETSKTDAGITNRPSPPNTPAIPAAH